MKRREFLKLWAALPAASLIPGHVLAASVFTETPAADYDLAVDLYPLATKGGAVHYGLNVEMGGVVVRKTLRFSLVGQTRSLKAEKTYQLGRLLHAAYRDHLARIHGLAHYRRVESQRPFDSLNIKLVDRT